MSLLPQRVIVEVQDGDESLPADPGQPLQRQLPLLLQRHVIPRPEQRVREQQPELVPHIVVVVVEKVPHGGDVEGGLRPRGPQFRRRRGIGQRDECLGGGARCGGGRQRQLRLQAQGRSVRGQQPRTNGS